MPTEPGFSNSAIPAKNALPLPVEIAQDIAEISESGVLYVDPEKIAKQPQVKERTPANTEVEETPQGFVTKGPLGKKGTKGGPLGFVGTANKNLRGKTINYMVRLGDTLMKIAFEKHGNYLRWREIYKVNRKKMTHYTKMKVGTVLTIKNVRYVFIRKQGKPYLIRKRDTLKSIAQKVYGDSKKWRSIWKNNPQLIRNPRKIYAGFTLYYEPTTGQDSKAPTLRKPTSTK